MNPDSAALEIFFTGVSYFCWIQRALLSSGTLYWQLNVVWNFFQIKTFFTDGNNFILINSFLFCCICSFLLSPVPENLKPLRVKIRTEGSHNYIDDSSFFISAAACCKIIYVPSFAVGGLADLLTFPFAKAKTFPCWRWGCNCSFIPGVVTYRRAWNLPPLAKGDSSSECTVLETKCLLSARL